MGIGAGRGGGWWDAQLLESRVSTATAAATPPPPPQVWLADKGKDKEPKYLPNLLKGIKIRSTVLQNSIDCSCNIIKELKFFSFPGLR